MTRHSAGASAACLVPLSLDGTMAPPGLFASFSCFDIAGWSGDPADPQAEADSGRSQNQGGASRTASRAGHIGFRSGAGTGTIIGLCAFRAAQ